MLSSRFDKRWMGLVLAAAIATFLLMVAGNAVRVMNAGAACPDWPTCYGQWSLPAGHTLVEPLGVQVLHRALALLSVLLTGAAALWAAVRYRAEHSVVRPLALATALMLVEAALGGYAIFSAQSRQAILPADWLQPLHLGLALLSLALVTGAVVSAFYRQSRPAHTARVGALTPFARLARVTLLALFILLVSGTLVTASRAGAACSGWPLCGGGLPTSGLGWLAFVHRFIVLAVGVLIALQFLRAWKTQNTQIVLLPAATGSFLLLLGQVYIGAINTTRGFPADLIGLHAATAAGLWAVQVVLAVAAGYESRASASEAEEAMLGRPAVSVPVTGMDSAPATYAAGLANVAASISPAASLPARIGRRVLDFVVLSKPIIVLLLLVTTYAGLVVGGRRIPSLSLTAWTMLGGALAAGGASALNQYIDRETDKEMQRTAKRPIPGGRLQPAEGLAYGLGACLAAFFLLAGTVNLLAAVLSLAGMIYYVLIYSVWLKNMTVQNIVIGGGAGAIPPLVGWAAATGSLNVPALFLFAIIFFWTPPHFWALALVRRKDYARGRVPMLPVVRGEAVTRKQILIYTLELVGLTLLMPIFHMAGTVYLISALALGLWLIAAAWRVYKVGGNKTAWKMYRYSSMYLLFLMLALVLDVLI